MSECGHSLYNKTCGLCKEKLYTQSQLDELLRQQREACWDSFCTIPKYSRPMMEGDFYKAKKAILNAKVLEEDDGH